MVCGSTRLSWVPASDSANGEGRATIPSGAISGARRRRSPHSEDFAGEGNRATPHSPSTRTPLGNPCHQARSLDPTTKLLCPRSAVPDSTRWRSTSLAMAREFAWSLGYPMRPRSIHASRPCSMWSEGRHRWTCRSVDRPPGRVSRRIHTDHPGELVRDVKVGSPALAQISSVRTLASPRNRNYGLARDSESQQIGKGRSGVSDGGTGGS